MKSLPHSSLVLTASCLLSATLPVTAAQGYKNIRGAEQHGRTNPQHLENMNGDYRLSPTPGANGTTRQFPTQFRDYPDQDIVPIEFFDVYSPAISHLYSQVFWSGLPPVSLPNHIVDKYKGKVMAVVGFEIDQVMDLNGEERSVPINAVYNHHFESTMIGGRARFELASPNDPRLAELLQSSSSSQMGHKIPPDQPYWMVVGDEASATGQPTQQSFGGANGGEYRKSFHGYAPGFAQLIESPREFQITPMQIDTWHRDKMNLSDDTAHFHFVAGPLPRNSLAPPDAEYSGLLECPVTSRLRKHYPHKGYYPLNYKTCPANEVIDGDDLCAQKVTDLVRQTDSSSTIQHVTGNFLNRPTGCSMAVKANVDPAEPRLIQSFYNTNTENRVDCGSGDSTLFSASATSFVNVSVVMDTSQNQVTIQLSGPSEVWFGVGFGAQAMKDNPWTIIVDGRGKISERKIGDHTPGDVLQPSVQLISSRLNGHRRTVTVKRPLQGQYFSFSAGTLEIPFINAVGSSSELSYHADKEPSTLLLLPVSPLHFPGGGTCLCQQAEPPFGSAKGTLEYIPVDGQPGERGAPGKVDFNNDCPASPRGVLLKQKNPTCDLRTYTGGQVACHHMWSLLDADQAIPWPDQAIEYRLKFRFWVQAYNATYHTNVHRTTWGIGSPVEYDVPKCSENITGCSKELQEDGTERWVHTIRGTFQVESGNLVAAHFHCHAPTCLTTELYLCETDEGCDETSGELLCREDAVRGKGTANTDKKYSFDEPGFIYQPPCLWGSPEVGLEPPVNVHGRTLFARKTADATYGHHGEMAWLQMYYA